MKRAALGVLLISLAAGSTAFAGTVLPPALHNGSQNDRGHDRPDHRNDNGGRHDNGGRNDHRNDRGNDNWNRGNDHRSDGRRDDHRPDHDRNDRRWDNDHRGNDNRHYDGRSDNRRWVNPPRYASPPRYVAPQHYNYRRENGRWHWGTYYRPYGYAPHYWRRGDRLPVAYYGSSYVVGNYYDCGLRAPPYGYHWVRIDHDVVLAAIATGVVLDVIYNQFW